MRMPNEEYPMATSLPPIVDADGHIFENVEAIWKLMGEPYIGDRRFLGQSMFPQLDHLHTPINKTPPHSFDASVKAPQWSQFAKDLGIRAAVLYPTNGLSYGRMIEVDYAIHVCRAYNDWLYQEYLSTDPVFKGVALLPLQDPAAAAKELRRAVVELGMTGAMLPSNGLRGTLGDKEYWPVYEVANELGCALAVHGGAHGNMGLDQLRTFGAVHGYGHPFGIMISFASTVFNGIYERFPNVRMAFLEAGVSWILLALERLSSSYKAFQPWDLKAENLNLEGRDLQDYMLHLLRSGRVFVGVEGDELGLESAVRIIGSQPFVFSSDYPHEVNTEICRHEIEEVLENEALSDRDKRAILADNAIKLYGLAVPSAA
jgi:predicted TIM-barrel fold metal-dependent hydrolase